MSENTILDKAIIFAAKKHEGSFRKGDGQPYIFHPLEVLGIASLLTNDEEILSASVLHDTIEDTNTTKEEIEKLFNQRVANLVDSESENKRKNKNKESTWEVRKAEAIELVKNANDIGTKIICISDKLSNLRSFNRLLLDKGESAWGNFNMKDPIKHYWYYNELKKVLIDLKDTSVYKEYCFMIDSIFDKYIKGDKKDEQ